MLNLTSSDIVVILVFAVILIIGYALARHARRTLHRSPYDGYILTALRFLDSVPTPYHNEEEANRYLYSYLEQTLNLKGVSWHPSGLSMLIIMVTAQ